MNLLRKVLYFFGRLVLRLRYRVEIRGLDKLKATGWKDGMLFCPNHPAEMDPIVMINFFGGRYCPRPLVVEHFYHLPGAGPFMKLVNALGVPNFETTANKWKKKKADDAMQEIKQGLDNGDNFLIYPSGHLRRTDQENLGGSSFVHSLVSSRPATRVVLVRMEGLWGSSFSRAINGEPPDFWNVLFGHIWTVLKNGIFFVPKRKILITVEPEPEGLPKTAPRLEFNQFLNDWYNQYSLSGETLTHEPPTLVPYSFWNKDDVKEITAKEKDSEIDYNFEVPKEMRKKILARVSELSGMPVEKITDDTNLSKDAGFDSLDIATMQAYLDEQYTVVDVSPVDLVTVKDLFALALGKVKVASSALRLPDDKRKAKAWPEETNRREPEYPTDPNMALGFLSTCDRMGNALAICDAITGPITYKKLKIAVILFANILREKNERFIGIMLPSSSITYILSFATILAGKVPVMLNWTTGQRSLDYAHNLLDLKTIITSRTFLDRLGHLELGADFEKDLLFVEELRKKISLPKKLHAAMLAKRSKQRLAKRFDLDRIDAHDPAVLLFTSGTETYPKAVPLSHENLMMNQKAASGAISLTSKDCLYSVLPAFHSFGFSVTGTFPILYGVKVFFSPDPTDAAQMAKDIEQWKITLLCLAPTFYQNLFSAATKEQLQSLTIVVSGAEKAPDSLLSSIKGLGDHVLFIEGYGITECSPVVTINDSGDAAQGVGKPIEGVSLCIVDPESGKRLENNEVGEVCMKGKSIFLGYMTPSVKNPFIWIDGEQWYRSGDLGKLTDDGNLVLMGRIKRFIKVGGEMISLTAVEDSIRNTSIAKKWDPKEGAEPSVAAAVKNPDSPRPEIVLFTTFPVSKEDVNALLRAEGFGRIVKVAEVRTIGEIPLTGTGKTHFRKLDELVKE